MSTRHLIHNKYLADEAFFFEQLDEIKKSEAIDVVVSRISGLGDTFTILPFCQALKQRWPDARINILVNGTFDFKRLFSKATFDVTEIDKGTGLSGLYGSYQRLTDWLLGSGADLYFDLTQSNRGHLFAALSRATLKIGFKWHGFHKWFLDGAIDRAQTKFETESLLDQLRLLGIEDTTIHNRRTYEPPREGKEGYERWHQSSTLNSDQYFVLSPGASTELKRWPIERWTTLVDWLLTSLDCDFVLIEGPDEVGLSDKILASFSDENRKRVETFQQRPLVEVPHLIDNSAGVISHCSAIRHIAIVLNKPTHCIFNNSDPFRYRLKHNKKHQSTFDLDTAEPTLKRTQEDLSNWFRQIQRIQ